MARKRTKKIVITDNRSVPKGYLLVPEDPVGPDTRYISITESELKQIRGLLGTKGKPGKEGLLSFFNPGGGTGGPGTEGALGQMSGSTSTGTNKSTSSPNTNKGTESGGVGAQSSSAASPGKASSGKTSEGGDKSPGGGTNPGGGGGQGDKSGSQNMGTRGGVQANAGNKSGSSNNAGQSPQVDRGTTGKQGEPLGGGISQPKSGAVKGNEEGSYPAGSFTNAPRQGTVAPGSAMGLLNATAKPKSINDRIGVDLKDQVRGPLGPSGLPSGFDPSNPVGRPPRDPIDTAPTPERISPDAQRRMATMVAEGTTKFGYDTMYGDTLTTKVNPDLPSTMTYGELKSKYPGSTPIGAFQTKVSTIGDFAARHPELGITDQTVMTPEVQDRLESAIHTEMLNNPKAKLGTTWEGYKNQPDPAKRALANEQYQDSKNRTAAETQSMVDEANRDWESAFPDTPAPESDFVNKVANPSRPAFSTDSQTPGNPTYNEGLRGPTSPSGVPTGFGPTLLGPSLPNQGSVFGNYQGNYPGDVKISPAGGPEEAPLPGSNTKIQDRLPQDPNFDPRTDNDLNERMWDTRAINDPVGDFSFNNRKAIDDRVDPNISPEDAQTPDFNPNALQPETQNDIVNYVSPPIPREKPKTRSLANAPKLQDRIAPDPNFNYNQQPEASDIDWGQASKNKPFPGQDATPIDIATSQPTEVTKKNSTLRQYGEPTYDDPTTGTPVDITNSSGRVLAGRVNTGKNSDNSYTNYVPQTVHPQIFSGIAQASSVNPATDVAPSVVEQTIAQLGPVAAQSTLGAANAMIAAGMAANKAGRERQVASISKAPKKGRRRSTVPMLQTPPGAFA